MDQKEIENEINALHNILAFLSRANLEGNEALAHVNCQGYAKQKIAELQKQLQSLQSTQPDVASS